DAARYGVYKQVRGAHGLALSQLDKTLLATRTAQNGQPFAFHYGMPEIDALYAQGQVAALLNTGNLREPLNKEQYLAGLGVPSQLYSHPDQILQNQAGTPAAAGTGWGGRLLDVLGSGSALDAVAVGAGGLFVEGAATHGNLLPENGELNLAGMNFWPQTEADARRAALLKILDAQRPNALAQAANAALRNGMNLADELRTATSGAPLATVFPGYTLARQLRTVAQLIRMRASQGPGRQVFFVSMGGFDTHGGQQYQQWENLSRLSQSIAAFQAALNEIGALQQVTSVTMSDFGRSFEPNSGGTDHGWGSHHLVIGGAVRGGVYGQFPDLALGGPDDATGRGVWIPKLANQQVGATLGRWFGVPAAELDARVFGGELAAFGASDLGFMG
ncbi:MAG TPA: DUF1501 domain-containing protein, partial [Burkholderiaceae bacterium]